jgi:hypothetical protein
MLRKVLVDANGGEGGAPPSALGSIGVTSPVFNNEVKNDIGDENGTNYPQCLYTKYCSPIVYAPCRLDYTFPLVF